MKSIQRDWLDYEFTLVFAIDIQHFATCSKDRTGLFVGKPTFTISEETGKRILEWCHSGIPVEKVRELIKNAPSLQDLTDIYKQYTFYYPQLETDFLAKKSILTNSILNLENKERHGINNTIH